MASYDKYLAGDLQNYSISEEELTANIKETDPLQP